VADLSVSDPFAHHGLPIVAEGFRLEASAVGPIASVAAYPGRIPQADAALRDIGLGFPKPGRVIGQGAARAVWAGRATAFLMGVAPPAELAENAAVTDQSDGWAGLRLTGSAAEAVLARLVPLDLRPAAFARGSSARTLLNHMPCLILREAETAFELFVFRSMAGTAVHELAEAMRGVAARTALR
jgi:heterotetrameric sarcosine oxidase gamma subunit